MENKPYIPEECQYMAAVVKGELKAVMQDMHVEFCKAIIKDMEQYLKLGIVCKCKICRPSQSLVKAQQEMCVTFEKLKSVFMEVSKSNDVDKINELDKQMKKIMMMSVDNCQLHL